MSLIEKLNWRYATKKFDSNKKLSPVQLSDLLKAVHLSPSSAGLQSYKVIVAEDASTRKQLREAAATAALPHAREIKVQGARRSRGGLPFSHRSRMRMGMTEVPDGPGRCRDHQHAEDDMRGHDMRVSREVQQPRRHDQPESEDHAYPFFPFGEHRKRRQRQRAEENADDPGVPRGHHRRGESDDPR